MKLFLHGSLDSDVIEFGSLNRIEKYKSPAVFGTFTTSSSSSPSCYYIDNREHRPTVGHFLVLNVNDFYLL